MKASKLISALLLASIGLSVAAEASIAQSYYKVAGVGTAVKVYKTNQTPLSEFTAVVTNPAKTRVMRFNNCGWGKFKESASSPVFRYEQSGQNLPITTGAAPVCTKDAPVAGVVAPPTYTATNDASTGTVRRTPDGFIHHKGGNQQTAFAVEISTNSTKKAKPNQCGLVAISLKDANGSIDLGEGMTSVSGISAKAYPQKCVKVGSAYVLYEPPAAVAGGLN